MKHVPIVKTTDNEKILEFSHFKIEAPKGMWKRENIIFRECIKINVFLEGDLSIFSDEKNHRPIHGDICLFPPQKMHYGQIIKSTYVEYYQLDIGMNAFAGIPDGKFLLNKLIECVIYESFIRPNETEKKEVLQLCAKIEQSINENNSAMAFAICIELLSVLYRIYCQRDKTTSFSLSLHTLNVLNYIEKCFSENITIDILAQNEGVSESFLSRNFKKEVGIGIHEYLNQYRILRSLTFLKDHSITDTCYLCGFCDSSHFISVFKKHMNTTPMNYKKNHINTKKG